MPKLHDTLDTFGERNVPLCLLLGLISLARRFDRLFASELEPNDEQPRNEAPAQKEEHVVVYAILGIVSLRKTLFSELASVRDAHAPRDVDKNRTTERDSPPPLRDLLR